MYMRWLSQSFREGAWAPLFVFGLHLLAVFVFDLYHRIPNFDMPMHLAGGLAIAFFFHRTSLNASRFAVIGRFHIVTHWLLVFMSTCTAAVFWEFAEFI